MSEVNRELSKFRPHSLSTIQSSDGYQDAIEPEQSSSKPVSSCSEHADEDGKDQTDFTPEESFGDKNLYVLCRDGYNRDYTDDSSHVDTSGLGSEVITTDFALSSADYRDSQASFDYQEKKSYLKCASESDISRLRVDEICYIRGYYDSNQKSTIPDRSMLADFPDVKITGHINDDTLHDITNNNNSDNCFSDSNSVTSHRHPRILTLSKSAVVFSDGNNSTKVDMSKERRSKVYHLAFEGKCHICNPDKREISDIVSIDIDPHDKSMFVVFEPSFIDQGKGFYVSVEGDNTPTNVCPHHCRDMPPSRPAIQQHRRQLFEYPFRKSVCTRSRSVQCNERSNDTKKLTRSKYHEYPSTSNTKCQRMEELNRDLVYSTLRLDADKSKLYAEHVSAKLKVMMFESDRLLGNIKSSESTETARGLNKLIEANVIKQLEKYRCDLAANIEEVERTIDFLNREDQHYSCNTSGHTTPDERLTISKSFSQNGDIDASKGTVISDVNALLEELKTFHQDTATRIEQARSTLIAKHSANRRLTRCSSRGSHLTAGSNLFNSFIRQNSQADSVMDIDGIDVKSNSNSS